MQDINKEVGRRIRVLRLNRGFSQEELAFSSGLHRSYMGEIERGGCNITLNTLQRVGLALRISVSELVKEVEIKGRSGKVG
jgi:transcriptional regulator with XRE-family HTH domain